MDDHNARRARDAPADELEIGVGSVDPNFCNRTRYASASLLGWWQAGRTGQEREGGGGGESQEGARKNRGRGGNAPL